MAFFASWVVMCGITAVMSSLRQQTIASQEEKVLTV